MLSPAAACRLLLLGALCMDLAAAGSSFLSPEHQKGQQRKEPKKPPGKVQPRALEGWLRQEEGVQDTEDELEIRFSAPFDVGLRLSGAQYEQHGEALREILQDVLWEEARGSPHDK